MQTNKTAIIMGANSDIGVQVSSRLLRDGWNVEGFLPRPWEVQPWDMMIFTIGRIRPIGKFMELDEAEWDDCVWSNALLPLSVLRSWYPHRRPDARVFFFDGPNLSQPTPTYSAYRAGKAILAAVVPTLNAEYPDTQFTLLHTGPVRTKLHQQTLNAGNRAANYERVLGIVDGREKTTSYDEIYRMIVPELAVA